MADQRHEARPGRASSTQPPFPYLTQHSEREGLYRDLAPLVRRLIRQYGCEDVEMKKDLAGEIYCRFCGLLDQYDPARGVPLRPYLIRQLTASVYSYARQYRNGRRRELSLDGHTDAVESAQPDRAAASVRILADGPAASDAPSLKHLAADPTPLWDEALVREQLLDRLPALIEALPQRQRQAVIWRYYEQRSFGEMADRLQVKQSTVRSLLRHGLAKLRSSLAPAG